MLKRSECEKLNMIALLITPLIFSFSGEMRKATTTTYKHLTHLLSQKWSSPYSAAGYLEHDRGPRMHIIEE